MIDDVKAAFKQRLGDAEWMDAGTKRAALVKLEAITDMIGYPDYIKVGSVYIRQLNQSHTYGVHKILPSSQFHVTFWQSIGSIYITAVIIENASVTFISDFLDQSNLGRVCFCCLLSF